MAFTKLEEWSETAASNTEINGIVLSDSTQIDALDNIEREHMAQIAKWLGDDTLASATTTDLGSVPGRYVSVTGTTAITGLGTIKAGTVKYVKFADALTFTHNATSLILPGAANITTAAGDTAIMVSEGSGNWRCVSYQRAAQAPQVIGSVTAALVCGTSGTITLSGSTIRYVKTGTQVSFTGLLTVSSVSSPTGTLTMTGLPFTSVNSSGYYAAVALRLAGFTASNIWQAFISQNSSSVSIDYYSTADGTITANAAAQMKAGTTIVVGGTYFTA